jgi:hypothetical protein
MYIFLHLVIWTYASSGRSQRNWGKHQGTESTQKISKSENGGNACQRQIIGERTSEDVGDGAKVSHSTLKIRINWEAWREERVGVWLLKSRLRRGSNS